MTTSIQAAADRVSAKLRHETDRMEAELGYARALCDLNPGRADAWRPLIDQAARECQAAVAAGDLAAVQRAVAAMETTLAPLAETAKSYTIHCVGHAHIDMNWMWSWPETVAVTVDTFSTVLRLMEEYPAFRFSQSQASVYAILEKYRPDLLKRIARRVKEGRWEVTASHWVECDKNMASAESLCRHMLYTRQYMKKLFRLSPEDVPIDWSPDTFGHPSTVPSYLSRSGVKYLYMHRPGTHTAPKRWLFWWEGPDGSRVLVRNDSPSRGAYNGSIQASTYEELISYTKETGLKDFMFIYGVGDHGGGPTRRDIEQAIEMNTWAIFPTIQFSTTRACYDTVAPLAAHLPVWRGELNFEFAGCYTTQTVIKKANRYGENRLVDAEIAASLASAAGIGAYPAPAFEEGWRNVLFSHFHDILPGSGIVDTRTYSHGLYQQTMALTSQAEGQALQSLAAAVDTSALGSARADDAPSSRVRSGVGAGVGFAANNGAISRSERSIGHGNRPILLFNPTAADRSEVVEVNVWDNGPAGTTPMRNRSFQVRLPDGTSIPAQVTGGGGYWGHDHAVVAFPARVPGLGYAMYTIVEGGAAPAAAPAAGREARLTGEVHHCGYSLWERSTEGLENEFVRVEIDPVTGGILRLVDKASGIELVTPAHPAPALEYEEERPHGMSAWLVQHRGAPAEHPRVKDVRRGQKGPYQATLEIDLGIRESEFTLTYELRAGDPRVFINIRGTWFQRGTRETSIPSLSFALPLALENAHGRYEIPFGTIDRTLNRREEVPSQQWAQVTGTAGGKEAGCLLLNDCKYGHSLEGNVLRLTLIRSSFDPDILPEIGYHEIRLALYPFAGDLPAAEAIRKGQEFNRGIRIMGTDIHEGLLPLDGRFVAIGPDAAILTGIKKAEQDDRLVFRLFNPTDKRVTAKLDFGRSDVMHAPMDAEELDLLERPLPKGTATLKGKVVSAALPPHGIVTVAVGFRE